MHSQFELAYKCVIGGILMGLANLVPGISGGTMLLAAGVYPLFINAIAEITSLKFEKKSFMVVAFIGCSAALAILTLAGAVHYLVSEWRWVMYSLFIGLTLGGMPILRKLIGHFSPQVLMNLLVGLSTMILISYWQIQNGSQGGSSDNIGFMMMLVAGIAGSSAMILPGISGGFLLLIMGVYLPILQGIDSIKIALRAGDFNSILDPVINIALPVSVGIIIGVVVVSHVLKYLLAKFEKQTYGFLLGLLLGAVFGLWPFQQVVPLEGISEIKNQKVEVVDGQLVYQESQAPVKLKDLPTTYEAPNLIEGVGSVGIIILGFFITVLVAKMDKTRKGLER